MHLLGYLLSCALYSYAKASPWIVPVNLDASFGRLGKSFDAIDARMDLFQKTMKDLARQTMLQQFTVEDAKRTEGDSGVKLTRLAAFGPKSYQSSTHVLGRMMAAHDHSNYCRIVGMGEINAIINGVEFTTRHNDYRLVMKSTTSKEYKAVEEIPYPDVPPEVLEKETVEEQVEEMGEWFKAFNEQNDTLRNYTQYFKPVLCYLEGIWTADADNSITESFMSERHFLDATSWFDLAEKSRFARHTGGKSRKENQANLPTTIMNVDSQTGIPTYAQYNYQILCHPISMDIPLKYFKQVDELHVQLGRRKSFSQVGRSQAARYMFTDEDTLKASAYALLDKIMGEIPGLDNIPDNRTESLFGEVTYQRDDLTGELIPLRAGYYSRRYITDRPGAMGVKKVNRNLNDKHMWTAMNNQPQVAPMISKQCSKPWKCQTIEARYSWAIPLEIHYLTPLFKWNPYNITIHDDKSIVTAYGRDGSSENSTAYNGTHCDNYFYRTPQEFFSGKSDPDREAASTGATYRHVLDSNGTVRRVSSSGYKGVLFSIAAGGAGFTKLRWPIAPIFGEGNTIWKELDALKDLLKDKIGLGMNESEYFFETSKSFSGGSSMIEHSHEIKLTLEQLMTIKSGDGVSVETTRNGGHSHKLVIKYDQEVKRLYYFKCDGRDTCWDKHPTTMFNKDPNVNSLLNSSMM